MTDTSAIVPGDLIIVDHGYITNQFLAARVVKVGKVMWEIEQIKSDGSIYGPVRRKVENPIKVANDCDPQQLAIRLRNLATIHRHNLEELQADYKQRVRALATEGT